MEGMWAKELGRGSRVKVTIDVHYTGTSARPESFTVRTEINGRPRYTYFDNESVK